MRYLYNIIFYLAVPFILFRLFWRSRKANAYGKRWHERFAYIDVPRTWQNGLWVHAVSVGEVSAAAPLVKAIRQRYPNLPVVITTMTPTGSARVKTNFADNVFHTYVPYDLPTVVRRFLNRVKPCAVMILETELWPNILRQSRLRHIPVMIANARLSEKSFRGYAKFPKLTQEMLSAVDILATHAEADARCFIKLGMEPSKVSVTGSIKFEIKVPASILEQAQVLRNFFGQNRHIWIAASTHQGEDEQILAAHRRVLQMIPDALLILTPRHPERFDDVYQLAIREGFIVARRSHSAACRDDMQVFLGDTMGELMLFFAASDLAFVGGSLVDTGGHNLLEPASLGIASISGPSCFNFVDITQILLDCHATLQVKDSDELAEKVIMLLQDSHTRADMGERGRQVIEQNRGALAAHLNLLEEFPLAGRK